MCKFFSIVSTNTKMYYFDWELRKLIVKNELIDPNGQSITEADSHSQICAYYNLNADKVNKYEYNFFTKGLTIDQINIKDDSDSVLRQLKKLNVRKIVEPLIIKKIIIPVKMKKKKIGLHDAKKLLRKWDSVRDSVWASVRDSVWASVRDSVWDSVRASVWASVWAYISSFFDIKYNYDFSSCVKLWETGYVPSYDGKIWRLHGYKGKILYEDKEL